MNDLDPLFAVPKAFLVTDEPTGNLHVEDHTRSILGLTRHGVSGVGGVEAVEPATTSTLRRRMPVVPKANRRIPDLIDGLGARPHALKPGRLTVT
jgi:hypothetical protein